MTEQVNEHERWREELAAYLLGALDARAAEDCKRHLERCERCQAEVRWLMPAVDRIPHEVPRMEPPAELRERIMSEARADVRAPGAHAPTPAPSRRSSWFDRLIPGGLRPITGLAAVLLVCAAVAGYWVGTGGDGGGSATTTYVAGESPSVTATVEQDGVAATLRLTNVEPLPERRILQAWVQRGDQVEPVPALFAPDHAGDAQTTIEDMSDVEAVMVTTEPTGGSDAPTEEPFVRVEIQ